jgi:hypothetical protein
MLRILDRKKSCAPLCTVSCVHRVALLDRIRTQPITALDEMMPASGRGAAGRHVKDRLRLGVRPQGC